MHSTHLLYTVKSFALYSGRHWWRRAIALLLGICLAFSVSAQESDLEYGVDVSGRYRSQTYANDDASLYSITLSPYFAVSNWVLGIDMPWHRVDGYYRFYGTARQENFCYQVTNNLPLPQRLEAYRTQLANWCARNTVSGDAATGTGDLNFYASYGNGLAGKSWFLTTTLGYTADNGDADKNLGSGTRDLYFDVALSGDFAKVSTSFLLGYNTVLGEEFENFYPDYSYFGAELSSPKANAWVFGGGVDWQNAATDSVTSLRIFTEWELNEMSRFKVEYKHYEESELFPESALDASLQLRF